MSNLAREFAILLFVDKTMTNQQTLPPREVNYDEARVPPYTLPDPLVFADGRPVKDAKDWAARRREILDIFAHEMYGVEPPPPEALQVELVEEGTTLAGLAIRRQYRLHFRADGTGPYLDWLVLIPNRRQGNAPRFDVDGKPLCENDVSVPAVLFLNYKGNHTLLSDPEVILPDNVWSHYTRDPGPGQYKLDDKKRGEARTSNASTPFPVETILSRGYAVMSCCYAQISPDVETWWHPEDDPELAWTGIFDLWGERDPNATDNTTALGAWAWALSRGLDLAERIPEIDAKRAVATGCSRLAKTALLACARDERFAVCVPCQTGGGGVPLAKRFFGESVGTEMRSFKHWYCPAYARYADNEAEMPFDQHWLLAAVAPRGLLVEGFNSRWFDTHGEFLACQAASPVWEFLGRPGLPKGDFPANFDTSRIGPALGYVRRGGEHGISGYDWIWLLDFADRYFRLTV